MSKKTVTLSLVDLCEPCIQNLRKLEAQNKLLDLTTVQPTVVLDAIEEALDEVLRLNTRMAKFDHAGPRFYENFARANSITKATSALVHQISGKLKAQMSKQQAR